MDIGKPTEHPEIEIIPRSDPIPERIPDFAPRRSPLPEPGVPDPAREPLKEPARSWSLLGYADDGATVFIAPA